MMAAIAGCSSVSPPGGPGGEQHQRRPQLLAAEAPDVVGHVGHGRRVGLQLGEQDVPHALHVGLHGSHQLEQACVDRAHGASSLAAQPRSRSQSSGVFDIGHRRSRAEVREGGGRDARDAQVRPRCASAPLVRLATLAPLDRAVPERDHAALAGGQRRPHGSQAGPSVHAAQGLGSLRSREHAHVELFALRVLDQGSYQAAIDARHVAGQCEDPVRRGTGQSGGQPGQRAGTGDLVEHEASPQLGVARRRTAGQQALVDEGLQQADRALQQGAPLPHEHGLVGPHATAGSTAQHEPGHRVRHTRVRLDSVPRLGCQRHLDRTLANVTSRSRPGESSGITWTARPAPRLRCARRNSTARRTAPS